MFFIVRLQICFVLFGVALSGQDDRVDDADKFGVLPANQIIKKIYSDKTCRYLAFTCGNHGSKAALKQLNEFLQKDASKDPEFKFVLIEAPGDLRKAFADASIHKISINELIEQMTPLWEFMITKHGQTSYYLELLKTIRKINLSRKDNPIRLLPVDAVTQKIQQLAQQRSRMPNGTKSVDYLYVSSINREEQTANNVLQVLDSNPGARGAIFYHEGHLLKRLRRKYKRLNRDKQSTEEEFTWSNWVGFVAEKRKGFLSELRVILFTEQDEVYNPTGTLDFRKLLRSDFANQTGTLLSNSAWSRQQPLKFFKSDSWIRQKHPSDKNFPSKLGEVFDAFVVVKSKN